MGDQIIMKYKKYIYKLHNSQHCYKNNYKHVTGTSIFSESKDLIIRHMHVSRTGGTLGSHGWVTNLGSTWLFQSFDRSRWRCARIGFAGFCLEAAWHWGYQTLHDIPKISPSLAVSGVFPGMVETAVSRGRTGFETSKKDCQSPPLSVSYPHKHTHHGWLGTMFHNPCNTHTST